MKRYMAVGLSVLAGAALFETALIPGLVIGGAAVLAPNYLPKLRRRLQVLFNAAARQRVEPGLPRTPGEDIRMPSAVQPEFGIKQAITKTITFRIIVTTLDFTTNYVVIGELATAAGLSTFNLIAGPLFYFFHETAWNHFSPAEVGVPLSVFWARKPHGIPSPVRRGNLTISRALAKTITFRAIATVMDFTTNYVVVNDAATAAGLSAFGFVVGPFIYLGHEKVWEYYGSMGAHSHKLPFVPENHIRGRFAP